MYSHSIALLAALVMLMVQPASAAEPPRIVVTGLLDLQKAQHLSQQIRQAMAVRPDQTARPQVVFAACRGGTVGGYVELRSVIREYHLATHVVGFAGSACANAFAAGARRSAAPGSIVAFHAAGSEKQVGASRIRSDQTLQDRLRSMLVADLGGRMPEQLLDRIFVSASAEAGIVFRKGLSLLFWSSADRAYHCRDGSSINLDSCEPIPISSLTSIGVTTDD